MPVNRVAFPRPDIYVLFLTILQSQGMAANLTQSELADAMDAGDDGDVLIYADTLNLVTHTGTYTYGGSNTTYGYSQYA